MHCPSCSRENREGAKFCDECGLPLPLLCPACGTSNRPQAKFCSECGTAFTRGRPTGREIWKNGEERIRAEVQSPAPLPVVYTPPHLAERIRAEHAAMESRSSTDGERKTITALFADLKGSTALIEGLDPEDARALIDPALQLMMDAVHRYEGYVAQALGDGIFALFGAPIAHEDHAQRALYAALRMQEEMRRYSDQVRLKYGAPLYMRVGVNTGEVVVRSIRKDDLHTDYVPVGHSTNLAARMEQLATPGSIVVTDYTYKLTAGFFEFKALGAATIKGLEEPLNVYEVLSAGPLRTRFQVTAHRGLTRFVGRQPELDQLRRALEQAKAGHGQIVGVMGEPGVGKSRLFYEFKLTSHSNCLVLEAYSISHGKASPYLPLIELLKNYFQIQPQDEERTRQEKIAGKVLILDRSLEDTLPYLFALLGLEDQPASLQQMDAQIRRRRTFEALKKLFLRESLNQPLILIFEDLHWIDTETQGFLDTLSESVASARLLLLVNYRPEYRHEWGHKTYYTQLRLAPLGQAEAETFLTFLLGRDAGLTPLRHLILEKTEGNPFFIEEVVQTLGEEGILSGGRGHYHLEAAPTALHISPTVQGVLTARIDRLAPAEKELLRQLAVMGREFPLSLVKQVVSQPEEELYWLLTSLQSKEFLYEQPAFPEVEYIFKHALTQEVAYGTVLQDQRKVLHERMGQALEVVYHSNLEDHYSELAHHYSCSGNAQKAVDYLQLAAQQAIQRSASDEAVHHLRHALDLLKALPDSLARTHQELSLQVTLSAALMATRGYAFPEVEKAYKRALELCRQVGDTPQLFPVQWGLWLVSLLRAELETARELCEQSLSLAHSTHDSELLLWAHYGMGASLTWLGEFAAARDQVQESLTYYTPQHHRTHIVLYGQSPGPACLTFTSWDLWFLGYPEQALQKSHEALALARELAHPFSLAYALTFAAMFHHFRREEQAIQERSAAVVTLSAEHGFQLWLAMGKMLQGWIFVKQGEAAEGILQIEQSLASWQATRAELIRPYSLGLLAEANAIAGQPEKGLSVLAEALTVVEWRGECWWEAELHRLQGTLALQSNGLSRETRAQKAEACFLKAIDVSRHQQAKSLELRAATSLARLWQNQGKQAEAQELLALVYNWFTEGFDTKDLQEAKALLNELAEGR